MPDNACWIRFAALSLWNMRAIMVCIFKMTLTLAPGANQIGASHEAG